MTAPIMAIPGQGLVYDGHDITQAAATAAAHSWLVDNGSTNDDADDATLPVRGLVARAWICRGTGCPVNDPHDWSFVQPDHAEAQAVTVVHAPCGDPDDHLRD
jgi:hypothetical protein